MALPASGAISLNEVNVELGLSGNAEISLNDTAVRALLTRGSGQVGMNNAHGKSNAATGALIGGFYGTGTGSIAGWTPQAGDIILYACTTWAFDNPVGFFAPPAGYTMVNYKVSASPWSGTFRAGARTGYRICDGTENPASLPRGFYGSEQSESLWLVYRFSSPLQSISLAVNSGSTSSGGSYSAPARSGLSILFSAGCGYFIGSPWSTIVPTQDWSSGAGNNQYASKLLDPNTAATLTWKNSAFRPSVAYTVFALNF